MADEADLHARIAALRGQINQHRYRPQPYPSNHSPTPNHIYAPRGRGRWATRGRGGRAPYHYPVANRVWVAGDPSTPSSFEPTAVPSANSPETSPASSATSNGFYIPQYSVGKKELMNKDTYEREQRQKQEYKEARAREARENASFATANDEVHVKPDQPARQISIEGIDFEVSKDGSKLMRVSDALDALQETPKKTTIAGVEFHRTKRGNLIRAPAQRDSTRFSTTTPKAQCETFTKQGSCPFGPKCHFAHDPEKVAICKTLLLQGTCPAGDYCDLSHEMTYHRVSACTHFLRGNCTNDACRYPHVNISPSAPVCKAFATLGYCASGEGCSSRHVVECPDHANRGVCTNKKCQLPHVDRASTMRKAAQRQAKIVLEGDSDLSSDDGASDHEPEVDEGDSDERDVAMGGTGNSRELSQQQDYISFS